VAVIDRRNTAAGVRYGVLTTKNGKADIVLDNYGVCVLENGVFSAPAESGNTYPVENAALSFPYDNVYRPHFFAEDTAKITVTDDMNVTVCVRTYPEAFTLLVDGQAVVCTQPCDELTACYSHLYVKTTVKLTAGEHILTAKVKDYGYLPAVLLLGDFMADGDRLRPRGTETAGAFWRTATVTAEVALSERAAAIETADAKMYMTAALDGETVGACAFPPYRFAVPEKFRGKTATLTLQLYTTLAPLFNDLAALKKADIFVTPWNDVPASTPETVDMAALNIRVKEN
ncbi:MAG: hypothetical protein J6L00_03680, partial [Clostridia bacterium]|nr:hypothetical protein [Clostridia bacterium]